MTGLFDLAPREVRVVEVGPRDGLQNISKILPTEHKLRYIELLAESGLTEIEITSFVSRNRVPQLADAEVLCAGLVKRSGVRFSALVPNRSGLDRALSSQVSAISLFTAASDTFSLRNTHLNIEDSLAECEHTATAAIAAGCTVRAYISTAWHCPFEGPISCEKVRIIAERLVQMGVDEISVGDTIGLATPNEVADCIEELTKSLPLSLFAMHLHDTYGAGLANCLAALACGVSTFDAASGGLGGCPFAPGAAGNLATEDLLHMLQGMNIETGVDAPRVVKASEYLGLALGETLPGKALAARRARN